MSSKEDIQKQARKMRWAIQGNRIKQEICETAFPSDDALAELDDIINEYIQEQREEEMIKLLKENLEKMHSKKFHERKGISNKS